MSTKPTENHGSILVIALLSGSFLTACSSEPETPVAKSSPEIDAADSPAYNFEMIPANEQDGISDIAIKTVELQKKRAAVFPAQNGKSLRGVHPKSHGCVIADLSINQDIVANLQVGLFANPGGQYQALVRFSNASVRLSPDLENGKNGSRGMAIKVMDVEGDVLIADKGKNNQDFLMINTPSFAFPNVRSYRRLTNALLKSPSGADPRGAFKPSAEWSDEDFLNFKKTRNVLGQIAKKTVRNPLEVQYFAAAPSSFGANRVMKFSAEPCGGEKLQEPFENPLFGDATKNYLQEALAFTMSKKENVCFDLKIQVLSAEQVKAHPLGKDLIEDASQVWSEEEFPFINVAKLMLRGPQDIDPESDEQKACESQAFNPWHSLVQHKPLGGINRLRKPVYVSSAAHRQKQ